MKKHIKKWLQGQKPVNQKMSFRGDKVSFEISKQITIVRGF